MKKSNFSLLITWMILFITSGHTSAQTGFTGFFDLLKSHDLTSEIRSNIELGQFEFGIESEISNRLSGIVTASYNTEESMFEPGTVTLTYSAAGNNDLELPGELLITAGLFDIPFGLDYRFIASPDRNLISTPLVVRQTINNINYTGVQIEYRIDLFNMNLYVLSDFNSNLSFGGRLTTKLTEQFEIGSSLYLHNDYTHSASGEIYGADFSYIIGIFDCKGEYIFSNGVFEGEPDLQEQAVISKGYYLELTSNLVELIDVPVKGILRFGSVGKTSLSKNSLHLYEIAAGTACNLFTNLIAKIEYMNEFYKGGSMNENLKFQLTVTL